MTKLSRINDAIIWITRDYHISVLKIKSSCEIMFKINRFLKIVAAFTGLSILSYIVFVFKRRLNSLDRSHGTYMYQGPEY